MKANLEFANVDFKLELRKQQQDQIQQRRQVDLKLQNVKAQVIVILSHLKNTNFSNGNANAFNIDFFFDPETELHFYFRQDLVIYVFFSYLYFFTLQNIIFKKLL